jgi:hypothetical protein
MGGRMPLPHPVPFGDAAWYRIIAMLPPDQVPDCLRKDIEVACGAFLARTTQLRKDIGSAAVLRAPKGKAGERSLLEQRVYHLEQAVAVQDKIGSARPVRRLQELHGLERQAAERQAQAAERQAEENAKIRGPNAYADQMYEREMQEWRGAITGRSSPPTKSNDDPLVEDARAADAAEAAWNDEVGGFHHDETLGDITDYLVRTAAKFAKRELDYLRKFEPPTKITDANNPFGLLVDEMARAWERAGLKPDANGRYGSPPTSFQRFMEEFDKNLLGSKKLIHFDVRKRTLDGLPTQSPRDLKAFYVQIARRLREHQ